MKNSIHNFKKKKRENPEEVDLIGDMIRLD
jgi:hypothetical protein